MLNQIKKIGLTAAYAVLIVLADLVNFVYPEVDVIAEIRRLN